MAFVFSSIQRILARDGEMIEPIAMLGVSIITVD